MTKKRVSAKLYAIIFKMYVSNFRAGKAGTSEFGSGNAVKYVANVIIPTLNDAGYKVK